MKQRSFASPGFDAKKRSARRERFLAEMDQLMPWAELAVVSPSYPTSGCRGRPSMSLPTMLRIQFMQQWYALSDPATFLAAG